MSEAGVAQHLTAVQHQRLHRCLLQIYKPMHEARSSDFRYTVLELRAKKDSHAHRLTTKDMVAPIRHQQPAQYCDQQQPPAISCSAACSPHPARQNIKEWQASSMRACNKACCQLAVVCPLSIIVTSINDNDSCIQTGWCKAVGFSLPQVCSNTSHPAEPIALI